MWRSTNPSQVDNLQPNISKAQGLTSVIETLFENYISPTAIMDRDFNFIKVNKAYAQTDNREPIILLDEITLNYIHLIMKPSLNKWWKRRKHTMPMPSLLSMNLILSEG